jgi:predicted kinase
MNDFSKFTNLYEVSKTLRFELKPVGETQTMLEENNVFQKDEEIQKKYQETKKYFDKLHRDFVKEALQNAQLSDLDKYTEALKNVKKITRETDKKQKDAWEKALQNEEKRLRKEVVELFNATAKIWATEKYSGLKNKDLKFLDEEAVFEKVLLEKYGKDSEENYIEETLIPVEQVDKKTGEMTIEKKSIFADWKGFTGYFTKFFETRKNFYKDDGTSTAIATRIVDQNLRRFVENINTIKFIQKNYPDFSFAKAIQEYGFDLNIVCDFNFYASYCLLQEGIDEYNKFFVGEIKYAINHYRQANKGVKIPYLKTLDKQILSKKERFIDEIENNVRLKEILSDLLKTAKEKTSVLKNLFEEFVNHQEKFDLEKIYFSKKGFEQISRKWTFETKLWEEALASVFKTKEKKNLKQKDGGGFPFPDFISLEYLKLSLESLFTEKKEEAETFWKEKYNEKINKNKSVWSQFLEIFQIEFEELFVKNIQTDKGEKIIGYGVAEGRLENLLQSEILEQTPELKLIVKDFADKLLSIYRFSKYFAVEKSKNWDDSVEIDDEFYYNLEHGFFDKYYKNSFELIITPYNLLRNYLTKKPWEDVQKWKLNFENSTLADGWDKNKEIANFAVILRKNGKYFLGLMKKGCNHLFTDKNKDKFIADLENGSYEKMVYKYLPGAAKMIPKGSTQLKNVKNYFLTEDTPITVSTKSFITPLVISKRIFELNNVQYDKGNILEITKDEKNGVKQFQKEYLKLSNNFSVYKSALNDWINFCKDFFSKYDSTKDFDLNSFKKTEDYNSLDEFYKDIDKISYKIFFQDISEKYIEEKNKNGELYLFQIKNKDWNEGSTGAKNLHTLYFESLFSTENIAKNFVFKLNGQAEVFYRPKVSAEKLGYKKDNSGEKVINHKRYNENKIFFHVPIALNREDGNALYFNRNLNEFLANNDDINIIGIDRGEKHLAYYSVINQKQEILKDKNGELVSGSLNFVGQGINGKPIDYHEKLENKANGREQARKDWQTVEGIKDLKKGYISQVVRKLADLAIEYNAIIVFEDLNMRFKQIRGGIEKSAYQQLEKALIEKLNFLVNKGETNAEKAGHLLKAYQLTDQFDSFQKMGKQTGILFYTTASYTSKIDPITGWRPNLYLKKGNAKINKGNILKFSRIELINECFEFTYDLEKFRTSKEAKLPQKTEWTVCSCVERFKGSRKEKNNNQWGYDYYPKIGDKSITESLRKIFKNFEINVERNIKEQISKLDENDKKNARFFSDFLFFFSLICQIRNTNPDGKGNNNDFILSPVEPFFDSRKDNGKKLPKNGDDNGAFNIARKGVITLRKINQWKNENKILKQEGKKEKTAPNLFISNQDWDNFTQNRTPFNK